MFLLPHPTSEPGPIRSIEVLAARREDGSLELAWKLDGDLSQLRLPAAAAPERADALWRHACFEAFIVGQESGGYLEFNFAPSGQWAGYSFGGYRTGMGPLDLQAPPAVRWRRGECLLQLDVTLRRADFVAGPLRLAFAAVIEEQSGTISYWALRHPQGKPDFHHPDGFVLELPPGADRA